MALVPRRARLPWLARLATVLLVGLSALAFAGAACADAADAHIAPPQDTPYPGTLKLHVDASDTRQGIFRVHETIPVAAGVFYRSLGWSLRPEVSALLMSVSSIIVALNAVSLRRARI